MKVLVTGGTGLVGKAISTFRPEWVYLSSKDCDLNDFCQVSEMLKIHSPDVIVHLAANVGGLFKNNENRLEMFNSNLLMNYNILENAFRKGIKRVICCLSTCIFPDNLNRELTENDLHLGEPHHSNFGYAYAKRIMEVQCRLYNEIEGYHYQCIIPTNIYGPHDNFHLKNGHVVPSLIHKMYLHSKSNNSTFSTFSILGTGTPRRQFIYSYDLATIIIHLLEKNITEPLLICSPPVETEISILEVAKMIAKHFDIDEKNIKPTESDNKNNDGQHIKTASCSKLLSVMPYLKFTSLEHGLSETVKWFNLNYPNIRC